VIELTAKIVLGIALYVAVLWVAARNPRAAEGWERMSPSHRRGHLFGIFYYRTPEARDRRLAKTIEDAIAKHKSSN